MSSLLTPAGFLLMEHLPFGQALRAGSTVTHPAFSTQGLPDTAVIVEILNSSQGELSNGLTLPLRELQPVKTDERWVKMEGASVPYLLSDQGKVVSLKYARQNRERLLRHSVPNGFPSVSLWLDQQVRLYHVARLVAQHFFAPCGSDMTMVQHLDQNRLNLHYTNLRWVDKGEIPHGVIASMHRRYGQDSPRAKLTAEQVHQIRQRAAEGEEFSTLAREFGVAFTALARIVQGRSWQVPPASRPATKFSRKPEPPGRRKLDAHSLPVESDTRRTSAGVALVDYLLPGEPLRAGATVTHPGWAAQGLAATAQVVEVHVAGFVTLTNGLRIPSSEVELVETQERWVYIQGVTARLLLSDQGQVVNVRYFETARERRLRIALRKGHPNIVLTLNKQELNKRVVDLVAQHFLAPPPSRKMNQVVPRDGDPLNLQHTNLEWTMALEPRRSSPPKPRREVAKVSRPRLKEAQVAEIRSRYEQGEQVKHLAREFGVNTSTIYRVILGRTWLSGAEPRPLD